MKAMSSDERVQTDDGYPDTSIESEKSSVSSSTSGEDKKLLPDSVSSSFVSPFGEGTSYTPRSARRWQTLRFSPEQVKTPPFLLSRCPW